MITRAEDIEIRCEPAATLGGHTHIDTNFGMKMYLDVRPFDMKRLWVVPRWVTPCCGSNLYFTLSDNQCITCNGPLPNYIDRPPGNPGDKEGHGELDVERLEAILVAQGVMDPLLATLAIGELGRVIQERISEELAEFQRRAAASVIKGSEAS